MRRFALLCCVAVLAGCSKSDSAPAADTTAMAAAPAALTGADLAGTWNLSVMSETSDSVLVAYTLTATADTSGWMIMLPNRPPMALRVVIAGDSVIIESGPYESVLRKGVQVTTRGVSRLVNGELVGTTVAHYATNTADSVVTLRNRGTRTP